MDETLENEQEKALDNASVDALLKENPALLSELERRVKNALEEAKREWEGQLQEAVQNAAAQAEKLAKLSEQERLDLAQKQREEALEKREQALKTREMRALAAELLNQKGLPAALIDAVDDRGEEACRASVDALERTFRAAVQEGVEQRLKGYAPAVGDRRVPDYDSMTDADYYKTFKTHK